MSINRVMITGNLTRDPELRQTTGGTSVLSFGVAVNDRRRNNQTGEWEDYPNFIDCQMFGKRADALQRYLSKGSKVAVEGKLSQDRWQDRQTGQNRSRIRVTVDELEFMSSRNGGGNGGYQNNNGYQQGGSYQGNGGYQGGNQFASGQDNGYSPAPAPAPNPAVDGSVYDEDIPF